ncbi:alkaline phosphatase D family protein [Agaribacter flavus]|uniref:Alkaline phosphatase D family protein n=1 Tax=Agaribacter flavus TaxID=1902781 RepID=A0ABV7FUQ6_9ALTE
MKTTTLLAFITVLANAYILLAGAALAEERTLIAFGSCSHQDKPLDILGTIAKERPHAMLFLGDNIYGDTEDFDELVQKYRKLGNNPNFQDLKQVTPLHAIWDDHDFGLNDGGKDFAFKSQAKTAFLDFWQVPDSDPRHKQEDGIYHSKWLRAKNGRAVHVIFPDLRWNRENIESVGRAGYFEEREPKNMGPYNPDLSEKRTMLGEQQWTWLEAELAKPADIKILASSLQILADFTGWEAWNNFPYDFNRLTRNIENKNVNHLLLISGDTHWAEISKQTLSSGHELWEVTSSGLSEEWKAISPNKHRVSEPYYKNNYGVIDIVWKETSAEVVFGFKDSDGKFVAKTQLSIDL